MALRSTVVRLRLQLADVDRSLYQDFPLTLAQHPSETDARLMLRVLAFALNADDRLEFGRGISVDDEPDLWLRSLDGRVERWIDLGTPDPDRLRKACGRADRVLLYAYGDRAVPVWWRKHEEVLARLPRLSVYQFAEDDARFLAAHCRPGATLQCTVSEGEALVVAGSEVLTVRPITLKAEGTA